MAATPPNPCRPEVCSAAVSGVYTAFNQRLVPLAEGVLGPWLVPGVRVMRVLEAGVSCIFASVNLGLDVLLTRPINPVQPYYVRLLPENKSRTNHTPWLIAYASFTSDGSIPEDDTCP